VLALVGGGHPGADLVEDAGHRVPAFLQDAVDAERVADLVTQ
jgi:hypothetical protein